MWAVYWLADGSGNDEVQSRNFVGQGLMKLDSILLDWSSWFSKASTLQSVFLAYVCSMHIFLRCIAFQAQGRESAFTFAQRVGGGQEMAWQCGPLRRLSWLQVEELRNSSLVTLVWNLFSPESCAGFHFPIIHGWTAFGTCAISFAQRDLQHWRPWRDYVLGSWQKIAKSPSVSCGFSLATLACAQ